MNRARALALLSLVAATTASAQSAPPTNASAAVPIRELGPIEAKTKESVGLILGNVRHLPSGSLLVNDAGRRRVLLFDEQLATYKVVIDSTAGSASYGPRASPMIAYLGDSSLFVDAPSQALLVIDENGKVARVMSAPNPRDLPMLSTTNSGVDDRGRLVYRGRPTPMMPPGGRGAPVDGRGGAAAADRRVVVAGSAATAFGQPTSPPDSSPIVRADFDTRKVDTIALLKTSTGGGVRMVQGEGGRMTVTQRINPLSTIDEWAVLSDGSVAMVRGHDYHIDWYLSDGTHSSSGKLPFDWRRLTDDDKQKLIDSAQTAAEAQRAAMEALGGTGIAPGRAVDGGRGAVAPPPMAIEMRAAAVAGMPGAPTQMIMETEYVPLNEIPDYYPPIRPGAAKPDADGNLWILPTTSAQSVKGELVYDVVNRASGLVFRARIPAGRSIVGFGRGGIVYMMTGSRAEGFFIERARLGAPTRVTQ